MCLNKGFCLSVVFIALICPAVLAKDLYVSPSGNDSVSYSENSISNPWKTLSLAIYQLKAGDTLYIRSGTYAPEYTMYTKDDYTSRTNGNPYEMLAESGTSESPVTIKAYQGEQVVIDLSSVNTFISLDNKNYWVFEDLRFINSQTVFHLGYDSSSNNHRFTNIRVSANRGGDNLAAVKIESSAENTVVEYSVLEGPGVGGDIHLNTALIYATRVNNLIVKNNSLSNAPLGFYFKHANDGNESNVNILVESNVFENNSRRSIETNSNYAIYRNNLLGKDNGGVRNNEANGYTGGDYNQYIHNTFYNSDITFSGDTQGSEPDKGSIGVYLEGNVFIGSVNLHPYSDLDTTLTGSSNVFDSSVTSRSFDSSTSLTNLINSTDLINSEVGDVIFSGESLQSEYDFALSGDSAGVGLNDGVDAGVNFQNLGPNLGERPVFGEVIRVTE